MQGVAWNPKHPVLATLSSDRKCRFYNSTTKKLITKTYKALLNMPVNKLTRRKADKKDTTKTDSKNENDSATLYFLVLIFIQIIIYLIYKISIVNRRTVLLLSFRILHLLVLILFKTLWTSQSLRHKA